MVSKRHRWTRSQQKRNLVVACAKSDFIVHGKAFDVLRIAGDVNLDSLEQVEDFTVDFIERGFDGTNTVALLTTPRDESRGE
ncbi:MAG: hypothetical protein QOE70_5297 [Chthoniobacter sp.]|nr:hypothetical protein [Chthoniobacter sp.]